MVRRARVIEAGATLALVVLALAPRVTTLGQPLLEKHPWRQTWTAWGALAMSQDGIDFLRAPLPIFGPPWFFPQEFPITQAIGALLIDAGVGADLAMRVLGLATFFLCSWLLYSLVGAFVGRPAAVAAWLIFVFSPFSVVWSRTALVEYPALAGGLAYAWLGVRWRRKGGGLLFALSLTAGAIGMLIKPTGALFCTMPIALAAVPADARGLTSWVRSRLDVRFLALCLVPLAVGVAWTQYVDATLRSYPAMAFLAPSNVREYYLDPFSARFDPDTWQLIGGRAFQYAVGFAFLPITMIGLLVGVRSSEKMLWIGVVLAALLPVLVFMGGFRRHDYYVIQITWVIASFTGIGLAWLWERIRFARRVPLLVAFAAAAWLTWSTTVDYWKPIYEPTYDSERVLPIAREIESTTVPGELVVMVGRGHDTDALYYSHRRGLLLAEGNTTDAVLSAAVEQRYRVLASWLPVSDRIDVQSRWPWSGAIGAHTYALGRVPAELRHSPFVGTDDRAFGQNAVRAAPELLGAERAVPCDGTTVAVPAGARGTWLFVRATPAARISVSALYAPMPGRSVLVLDPSITFGQPTFTVICSGIGEIVIEAAYDAPPPE